MDLEIKTDQVDLDQSMYYMQMSLPTAAPFDMNRYQYQQNYPGAIFCRRFRHESYKLTIKIEFKFNNMLCLELNLAWYVFDSWSVIIR